jgi:opacity protein-like surface antigen
MRKFLVAAAVATAALAAAAPAAAQYYPAPQPYGYQQPYYGQGYGYGYGRTNPTVRSYQVRIDRLQRAIQRMDSRDRISEREARSLRNEARYVEARVRSFSRNGRLSGYERNDLNVRLARLEQRLAYELRDGNGRVNGNRGWNDRRDRDGDRWRDRDHDGRNDRYEDDRGRFPG